jgi:hypothetical protein
MIQTIERCDFKPESRVYSGAQERVDKQLIFLFAPLQKLRKLRKILKRPYRRSFTGEI